MEVQAYAFRALQSAAKIFRALGDDAAALEADERAATLQRQFLGAFWLEDLGTLAHALDARNARRG
ncbi:MAG: hypothetical protein HC933_09525 [Pleurocapsa sp. SU_196_0]|nr:hypothetical protein [Pleurocapsa sp. SU_196_0]